MESRVAGLFALAAAALSGCGSDRTPMAPAVRQRDSMAVMTTHGVSKMISDSGVIKYKIVAEHWSVYDRTNPPRQTFMNGIFMQKYDPAFRTEMYLTADTAYCYSQNLWELRGRVEVRKKNGVVFNTDELFWDMGKHEVYSSKYMHVQTPDEELEGVGFRSDEELTDYVFFNSAGEFPMPEEKGQEDSTVRLPEIPPPAASQKTPPPAADAESAGAEDGQATVKAAPAAVKAAPATVKVAPAAVKAAPAAVKAAPRR